VSNYNCYSYLHLTFALLSSNEIVTSLSHVRFVIALWLGSQFKLKAPDNKVQNHQFQVAVLKDVKESITEIQIPRDTISIIQKHLGST